MRRRLVTLAALLAGLCVTGAVAAATIVVQPGESIQAAINRASPGDTILVRRGTYREYLTIQKDNLTLKTSGGPGSVLLLPSEAPPQMPSVCSSWRAGFCVVGQVDEDGNLGPPVNGTRIVGFTVAHFFGAGVLLFNTNDSAVAEMEARHNTDYGISAIAVSKLRFANDIAHDNGLVGFYIANSPNANATVIGNQAYRTLPDCPAQLCPDIRGFGFLFRDASHGVVRNNRSADNCAAGFAFIDSGENPGPLSDWRATGNTALRNEASCPTWGPAQPPFGTGFLLWGTHRVILSANVAKGNAGSSYLPGGIVLASSAQEGGADPTDNVVKDNVALRNSPFDVSWDESGSGNVFRNNTCHTSQPSWICASSSG